MIFFFFLNIIFPLVLFAFHMLSLKVDFVSFAFLKKLSSHQCIEGLSKGSKSKVTQSYQNLVSKEAIQGSILRKVGFRVLQFKEHQHFSFVQVSVNFGLFHLFHLEVSVIAASCYNLFQAEQFIKFRHDIFLGLSSAQICCLRSFKYCTLCLAGFSQCLFFLFYSITEQLIHVRQVN